MNNPLSVACLDVLRAKPQEIITPTKVSVNVEAV